MEENRTHPAVRFEQIHIGRHTGGYFVSNGTRGSGKEEILRSYHEAKEAEKALSWLGWGKSVCFEEVPPELPWESEWKQDGKKQLDVFIIC